MAAESSGQPVIARMPLMAEFYRKRVNERLRAGRSAGDPAVMADAKARLEFLRWAESWMRGPRDTWPVTNYGADHADRMNGDLAMIGYALQFLIRAYSDHPQFRPEWRS
jgi:hypothetical protein